MCLFPISDSYFYKKKIQQEFDDYFFFSSVILNIPDRWMIYPVEWQWKHGSFSNYIIKVSDVISCAFSGKKKKKKWKKDLGGKWIYLPFITEVNIQKRAQTPCLAVCCIDSIYCRILFHVYPSVQEFMLYISVRFDLDNPRI